MAPDHAAPGQATPVLPLETPAVAGHPARPAGTTPATQPRWRSSDLFGGAQEVEIEHGDVVYRLRQTALGKLIMTK